MSTSTRPERKERGGRGDPRRGDGVESDSRRAPNDAAARSTSASLPDARVYKLRYGLVTPTPLLPFQAVGVALCEARGAFLVRDGTGLGKTIQGLYAAYDVARGGEADRVLVVLPSNRCAQWEEEVRAHLPGVSVRNLQPLTADAREWGDADVVLLPYELLARSGSPRGRWSVGVDLRRALAEMRARRVVLLADELHHASNPTSNTTRALLRLAESAAARFGLTASVTPERPENVFVPMRVITLRWPYGSSYTACLERYTVRRRFVMRNGRSISKIVKRVRLRELGAKLEAMSIRRDATVAGLPEERVLRAPLDMHAEQRARMRPLFDSMIEVLEAREEDSVTGAMFNPRVGEFGALFRDATVLAAAYGSTGSSPKLDFFVDRMRGFDSGAILWCYHHAVVEFAVEYLRKSRVKTSVVYGKMRARDKLRSVQAFYHGTVAVIVGTYPALSEGEDKLKRCPYAFHLERWWPLRFWTQSRGRNKRVGGTRGIARGEFAGMVVHDAPILRGSTDAWLDHSWCVKEQDIARMEGRVESEEIDATVGLLDYLRRTRAREL